MPPLRSKGSQDVELHLGDCTEVLTTFAGVVDAVVTDPPYGLEFMGADFDSLSPKWKEIDDVPKSWIEDYLRENNTR